MDEPAVVYNFEVEDWHTYYVSNSGVLVHNDCGQGMNEILSNKTYTNSTSRVDNYVSPTKGIEAAKVDFRALNPTNVRTLQNGTILGDLANGTTINIHPGSSVGGAPTLQIPNPATGVSIKIRY